MSEGVSRKITKTSKWRGYQRDNLSKKRISWGLLALGVLFALIALGKLLSFIGSLDDPYNPDGKILNKGYQWSGNSNINLVIKSDKVKVLSFNPTQSTLTILTIPDESYLSLPFEYGKWTVNSIYELGQAEKEAAGAVLLEESIKFTLGLPIDGYIFPEGKLKDKSLVEVIEEVRTTLFGPLTLIKNSKTDLSLSEYINFAWGIKGVRFDKIKEVDLSTSGITKPLSLADGSSVVEINQASLDQLIQKNFEDLKLSQEGLTVGIFNSTNSPGLAEKASRIIMNMGGRVIFTSNYKTPLESSITVGKNSYTKEKISQIFSPSCLAEKNAECLIQSEGKEFERADINIILGQDFASKFFKK